MTEEEKYIDNLFKTARNESPKRSYKETANHFEKTIITTPLTPHWSKSFLKYMNLNTLLMTTIGSLIIASLLWSHTATITSSQTTKAIEIAQNPPLKKEVTPIIPATNKITSIATQSSTEKEKHPFTNSSPTQKVVQKKKKSQPISTTKNTNQEQVFLIPTDNLVTTTVEKKVTPSTVPSTIVPTITSSAKTNTNRTVNQTNTLSATKIKVLTEQSNLLKLTYTDNEKIVTTFLEKIRFYGFSVTEKVNRNSGKIERINLTISLYKGLDWKIKLKNFEIFELKILLDEYKDPVGLAYRLSDTAKFSETISLKSRARSSHKFSKNNDKGHHSFTKYIKH